MTFVPGLQLCKHFYCEAVRPILDRRFPGLPHAAARIGNGSEILGFDDAMSTDHHWGPSLLLFLGEADQAKWADEIRRVLAAELPVEFMGYPTNYTEPNPDDNGVQNLKAITTGPVNHRVGTHTLGGFFQSQLGFDIRQEIQPADWLSLYEQRLLSVTAGAVYHDDLGLDATRSRFAYYPHDVWLYLLAADWNRISQEEHLMGRAGLVGDEIGSAVIGARLARDLMHLCFLMERKYSPYPKWFGTAFARLSCADELSPFLADALAARTWPERERHLVQAYECVARMHNVLGLTAPMPEKARNFFGRPFKVIAIHGFAEAILAEIRDPAVQRIGKLPFIGNLDQYSDSTDLLDRPGLRPRLRHLYE